MRGLLGGSLIDSRNIGRGKDALCSGGRGNGNAKTDKDLSQHGSDSFYQDVPPF